MNRIIWKLLKEPKYALAKIFKYHCVVAATTK